VYVEINPQDAKRLGIRGQAQVVAASRRGQIAAAAFVTTTVRPGQVFVPIHYAP
jgi:assimilatory nitrate reductase catalytic subunit